MCADEVRADGVNIDVSHVRRLVASEQARTTSLKLWL
jgi:hypothetical protein